jgi:hypothetical protein
MGRRSIHGGASRRRNSETFKGELVEGNMMLGVSVAPRAQEQGNLLLNWPRLRIRGATAARLPNAPMFVPVAVVADEVGLACIAWRRPHFAALHH